MIYLLAASVLWAFSFGLIKDQLTGLDPSLVALLRLAIAAAVFAPFLLRPFRPQGRPPVGVLALGALQFGLMYVLYIASYAHLPAWLVALFTVTTPLYVLMLAGFRDRTLSRRFLAGVILAVSGALVVVARGLPAGANWSGILLLQAANLCFAAGQVFYPRVKAGHGGGDEAVLAWMYLGAVPVAAAALLLRGGLPAALPEPGQWLTLIYLGTAPTAAGFYLWNRGAGQVSAGFLAAANNLKVPLAVVVAWTVFGETTDYPRALLGLALVVAALFVAGPMPPRKG